MPTFRDTLQLVPGLCSVDRDWLRMLVGDWQLIADLAIADLVLWGRACNHLDDVRESRSGGRQAGTAMGDTSWRVLAHVRPNTGPLVFYNDMVGEQADEARALVLDQAAASRAVVTASKSPAGLSRRLVAVPVVHRGVPIAVVTRHTDHSSSRAAGFMEREYRSTADILFGMIRDGAFPLSGDPKSQRHGTPRVGDGVIRMDADGVIDFASPNAMSALLRLGHEGAVEGEYLSEIVTDVLEDHTTVDEALPLVTMGRAAWRTDIEANGGVMAMRAIPLSSAHQRRGAVVLVRDISELRRQEQQLLTKDATIREIHHRVKNNLQTVAALLRLQARRVDDASARESLAEAGRRVSTISLVHETLSRNLDGSVVFDEIATRVINAIFEVAGGNISWRKEGRFGHLDAEEATPMALILAELVQNTMDHAFGPEGGNVLLRVHPVEDGRITVEVLDDGKGLPDGFVPGRSGLGTQIVRTFLQDLRGRIEWASRPEGGTVVQFSARVRNPARPAAE